MAWYKRYRVPFQSLGGTQYMVYIYEQTSGTLVTLTGAAEPFMTQEEDDTDIFTPIRTQSGYIRVIDETNDGSLLESLIPSNNTQKLVRLYSGTWNSDMTTFTDGYIMWQGFVCASAYTQQWDNQKKVIELPVKSLLAALADVEMPSNNISNYTRFAALIVEAFNALGVTPTDVVWISNLEQPQQDMLHLFLQRSMFFDEVEINNEGDVVKQMAGSSYFKAISYAAKMFGICLRESKGLLSLGMYDKNGGRIYYNNLTWDYFSQYVANGAVLTNTPIELTDSSLLGSVTFAGSDNVAEFIQGKKEAVITLDIKNIKPEICSLPMTTEDNSTTYEIVRRDEGHVGEPVIYRGQVFVQPHAPRVNSVETYKFYEYETSGHQSSPSSALYVLIGEESTYQNCLNNSVIFSPLFNPRYSRSEHLHTGCFPVRWYFKKDAQSQPMMKSGMMFNMMYQESVYVDDDYEIFQPIPNYCYEIRSTPECSLTDGYLHIKMNNYNFMRGRMGGDNDKLYFGQFNVAVSGEMPQTKLWCSLRVGNYIWSPDNGWVAYNGNLVTFTIDFNGDSIKTNKTTEMSVDESDGWFIPVPSDITLSGYVRFNICNVSFCDVMPPQSAQRAWRDAHCRIISDLTVDFLQNIDPMASRRSKNTYRQQILNSGFSEAKEVELSIGTFNNNIPSPCFIKRNSTTYIETLSYYTASSTETKRPELSLLGRMVSQYGQVRRAFTAVVRSSLNLIICRYIYLSCYFFGVVKKHNWRDDKQEVKFIEVT